MRNKVTIFVGEQELDVFQDEDITINLSVQNIQDISKVFTDFTQGFSVPASPRNNAIFEHYYRTDIVGGADYRLRADGRIEINGLVFRYGSIELEGVQMRKNAPYAYDITFYGLLVNLTDIFGEDYLYDLEGLSDYNHDYTQRQVYNGLVGTLLDPVRYPLISAKDVWFYDSASGNHDPNNIHFHSANETHGIQYYDLKPAITIEAIIEAIETKYGITINLTGVENFENLYMWCHRHAGYMYKDIPTAMRWTQVIAPSPYSVITTDWWNYSTSTFTPQGITGSGNVYDMLISIDVGSYANDYTIGVFIDGVLYAQQTQNGSAVFVFSEIPVTNNSNVYFAFKQSTNETSSCTVDEVAIELSFSPNTQYVSAYNSGAQAAIGTVDIPSLMPEQKVSDFLASLCKMFNLVIIPVSDTEFDLLPLDEWYASGTDVDLSQYFDITESQVERPQLYKQINFKYNETGAITGEEYRLTNDVGYGDLRSNFVFDTDEELAVEPQFDQMLFTRLTDQDTNVLTNVLAGYAITRELETYLGQPFLFYMTPGFDLITAPGTAVIGFVDESETIVPGDSCVAIDVLNFASSSSGYSNGANVASTNFGADLDPYFLQSVNKSLYNEYWSDYITDLYNPSRRLVRVPAILPLGKILNFDLKNKLIWNGQRWLVNNVSINLTTGRAEFELLNNV
jgi:hypothetical protein